MNGILCLGVTWILAGIFYGILHWEARVFMKNSTQISQSPISLAAFLDSPEAIGAELPPQIDHAAKGHGVGFAPAAICFYGKWLYAAGQPQVYSIWSENREVQYRCP